MAGLWNTLVRTRGNKYADYFLRATGLVALVGIPLALLAPASIPLVWLTVVGLPVTGPLGAFLPTGFESLVMEVAQHQAPLPVAVVGTAIFVYTEVINWHVYRWLLNLETLAPLREKAWMKRFVAFFARYPFLSVVVAAATPIPFWAARVLAIYSGYPLGRHLLATAVGRFPRVLFYAWVGFTYQPSAGLLLGLLGGGLVLALALRLWHGRRRVAVNPELSAATAASLD